jgi:hypothetical protein
VKLITFSSTAITCEYVCNYLTLTSTSEFDAKRQGRASGIPALFQEGIEFKSLPIHDYHDLKFLLNIYRQVP